MATMKSWDFVELSNKDIIVRVSSESDQKLFTIIGYGPIYFESNISLTKPQYNIKRYLSFIGRDITFGPDLEEI
jgi:hypothetical protein